MTKTTYEYLKKRKAQLEDEIKKLGQEADSGHQRAAVHDEQASVQYLDQLESELSRIGDLRGVKLVDPRRETDKVDLGNRVKVSYVDDEEERALILSSDDSTYAPHTGLGTIITPESPVGKAIMKKSAGLEIEIKTKPPTRVKIKSIEPGDF